MSDLAPVLDLDLARFVRLEHRVAAGDTEGLRARWEFGRELLSDKHARGFLKRVAREVGVPPTELRRRRLFAERFPTAAELDHAVIKFRSWHGVVQGLARLEESEQQRPIAVPPEGLFRTICADPPWQYGNTATRGAAEDHYGTMSLYELCDPEWVGAHVPAAEDAHLYLWTTNGFLREAFDVMAAWGFTYKTCVTWVKPQLGIGNYFRGSSEHVLFGLRGRLPMTDKNQPTWFQANRTRHSAKPDSFYDLVEKVSPGPYLELFSRRRRFGWEAWGDEA